MNLFTIMTASKGEGGYMLEAPTIKDTKGREWQICFSSVIKYNRYLADAVSNDDPFLVPLINDPDNQPKRLVCGPFPPSLIAECLGTPGLLVDITYDEMLIIRGGGEVDRPQTVETVPGLDVMLLVVKYLNGEEA